MRYITSLLTILAIVGFGVGCKEVQPRKLPVDITLKNASTHDLAWVEFIWKGPSVPGGVMSPGVSTTSVSAEWPNLPGAKINFIDRQTRKPYSMEVSLASVNERVLSGECHDVVILILDYDKAEVDCK